VDFGSLPTTNHKGKKSFGIAILNTDIKQNNFTELIEKREITNLFETSITTPAGRLTLSTPTPTIDIITFTMMFHQLNGALLFLLTATQFHVKAVSAQPGSDYLDVAPATVYEDTVISPQNMYVT
jgi:hypothetical protein